MMKATKYALFSAIGLTTAVVVALVVYVFTASTDGLDVLAIPIVLALALCVCFVIVLADYLWRSLRDLRG
jgi:hypothetical protein